MTDQQSDSGAREMLHPANLIDVLRRARQFLVVPSDIPEQHHEALNQVRLDIDATVDVLEHYRDLAAAAANPRQ